jgi:uncharacterized membrane protein
MSPDVIFHALAGVTGILSGATALFTRKGSRVHRTAGTVFFISMMTAAATAIYLAWRIDNPGFMVGGVLIIYLLATGWMTAKRQPKQIGAFEIGAFLIVATGAVASFWFAIQAQINGTAFMGGIPAFTFSIVAALAAVADLSVILRRGLSGKQRIARHLWRTHVGLFAAVGSFFPGQLQFFPEFIQQVRPIILLFIPSFLIIGLMFFWLARLFFSSWYGKRAAVTSTAAPEPAKAPA